MFNIFMKDKRMNNPKEKRMSKMFKYTQRAFCYLSQKKIWKSLCNWNKLLTNRPEKAIEACIYRERSKIYFKNNLYKQCLRNIKLAEEREDLTLKLQRNKYFCERQIDTYGMYEEIVNSDKNDLCLLSQTTTNQKPWIENCLKLRRDAEMKPYIITDRQLSIGDVICFERGLFTFSNGRDHPSDLAHTRCYNCLIHNNLDLVPCFDCDSGEFT